MAKIIILFTVFLLGCNSIKDNNLLQDEKVCTCPNYAPTRQLTFAFYTLPRYSAETNLSYSRQTITQKWDDWLWQNKFQHYVVDFNNKVYLTINPPSLKYEYNNPLSIQRLTFTTLWGEKHTFYGSDLKFTAEFVEDGQGRIAEETAENYQTIREWQAFIKQVIECPAYEQHKWRTNH